MTPMSWSYPWLSMAGVLSPGNIHITRCHDSLLPVWRITWGSCIFSLPAQQTMAVAAPDGWYFTSSFPLLGFLTLHFLTPALQCTLHARPSPWLRYLPAEVAAHDSSLTVRDRRGTCPERDGRGCSSQGVTGSQHIQQMDQDFYQTSRSLNKRPGDWPGVPGREGWRHLCVRFKVDYSNRF